MPQEHLIDVRSPLEFASGALVSDIAPTINIEYTQIDSLTSVYASQGLTVAKNDNITLYCRSGRRSDIAMRRLKELGYANVRDIGGFEDAKRTLDKETVQRQLNALADEGRGEGEGRREAQGGALDVKRQESLDKLLSGLRECDA